MDPELTEYLMSHTGMAEMRLQAVKREHLLAFIRESNAIENIKRRVRAIEVLAHREFLALDEITVHDLEWFVDRIGGKPLRRSEGMNASIVDRGSGRILHVPPPGGPSIEGDLREILIKAARGDHKPYAI